MSGAIELDEKAQMGMSGPGEELLGSFSLGSFSKTSRLSLSKVFLYAARPTKKVTICQNIPILPLNFGIPSNQMDGGKHFDFGKASYLASLALAARSTLLDTLDSSQLCWTLLLLLLVSVLEVLHHLAVPLPLLLRVVLGQLQLGRSQL